MKESYKHDKSRWINLSDIRERRMRGYKAQFSYMPRTEGTIFMSFELYQECDYEKILDEAFKKEDWRFYTDYFMN